MGLSKHISLACKVGAELGEGPVWVERDAALWFVDIKGPRVHRFDPATGERRSWEREGASLLVIQHLIQIQNRQAHAGEGGVFDGVQFFIALGFAVGEELERGVFVLCVFALQAR